MEPSIDPNAKTLSITIKCQHCGHKFPSAFVFSPYRTFDIAALADNKQQCPRCHNLTGADKEHFLAIFEGGGFLGNKHL